MVSKTNFSHASGFLFSTVRGTELSVETWERVAVHARAAGMEMYAEAAERQAQRGDD